MFVERKVLMFPINGTNTNLYLVQKINLLKFSGTLTFKRTMLLSIIIIIIKNLLPGPTLSVMYTAINMCPARQPLKPIKYKNKVIQ